MITTVIPDLDEVVPYTANYFENISLRNNKLVTDVFPAFNLANSQANALYISMNSSYSSMSAYAANALSSANAAALSAGQASNAAARAEAVVIPTTATYSYTQQDWRQSMTSKAEFNAMAAERRANRAGSGGDNMTPTLNASNTSVQINNSGLVVSNNALPALGGSNSNLMAIMQSSLCVNGTVHNIQNNKYVFSNINYGLSLENTLYGTPGQVITLPPAPTVLPSTATLTQQQIDSGVIKHADASNSGLLLNGRNLTDTTGWLNGAGSHAVSSGKLQITNGTSIEGYDSQSYVTVIGKKYTLEIVTTDGTSLSNSIKVGNSIGASTLVNLSNVATATRTEVTFTATATLTYLTLGTGTTTTGETALFGEMGIFPADAISRSDLVFLESWHEDVSEKDFVYPLGNVQYLGTTGDSGTPVAGAFAGSATYSLFSDTWQADGALVGKGYVWSTLSDANKKAFTANPENNCYLDGDKVIQVRYRMRVVMGLGDSWANVDPMTSNIYTSGNLNYSSGGYIVAKGKGVTSADSTSSTPYSYFQRLTNSYPYSENIGLFTSSPYSALSYTNHCFALPIALVHRRNQGMMHPVYNPNGTKLASDSLPWYSTTVSFTSIADCFTDGKLLAASGYIGTVSGRADGLFYDQVHEGDISDLRMRSQKVEDYDRIICMFDHKATGATYRGSEGERIAEVKTQTTTGTVATVEVNDGTKYKSGSIIYIYDLTASAVKGRFVVKSISSNTLTVDSTFAKLTNSYLICGGSSTRTKSNTITVIDVIGSPANYPTAMKSNENSYVSLHTAEDGTSLLPTGTTGSDGLAVFKLSRDANATPLQVLKSTNSGATWTELAVTTHYTFSTTTNAITFTAGNIPLTTDLVRVTYQTHTNMMLPTTVSEVVKEGKVSGTNGVANGHFVYSLIGKVPTNSTAPYRQEGYSVYGYRVDTTTMKWSTTATELPLHTALTLAGGAAGVATVKAEPYLSRVNGKARLVYAFKEMKHNGTSYGDDGKVNMVDNVSTTTDSNALTVLVGTKYIELPYFISAGE